MVEIQAVAVVSFKIHKDRGLELNQAIMWLYINKNRPTQFSPVKSNP